MSSLNFYRPWIMRKVSDCFFLPWVLIKLQSLIMLNSEQSGDRPENVVKGRPRSNSYDRAISEGIPTNNRLPAGEPPPPVTQPRSRPPDNDFYSVKWIDFNHEQLPILLQNANGPCPLLAIANTLLLRKQVTKLFLTWRADELLSYDQIRFDPNAGVVSTDRVIATVADYMLQIDSSVRSSDGKLSSWSVRTRHFSCRDSPMKNEWISNEIFTMPLLCSTSSRRASMWIWNSMGNSIFLDDSPMRHSLRSVSSNLSIRMNVSSSMYSAFACFMAGSSIHRT